MIETRASGKNKTFELLKEIEGLQEKLERTTQSYVDEKLSQELFESLACKLGKEIEQRKIQISLVDDDERFIASTKRTIRFLEALEWYETILDQAN